MQVLQGHYVHCRKFLNFIAWIKLLSACSPTIHSLLCNSFVEIWSNRGHRGRVLHLPQSNIGSAVSTQNHLLNMVITVKNMLKKTVKGRKKIFLHCDNFNSLLTLDPGYLDATATDANTAGPRLVAPCSPRLKLRFKTIMTFLNQPSVNWVALLDNHSLIDCLF